MKSLSKLLVFVLLVSGANAVSAQNSPKDEGVKKAAEVKNLVNSGRYMFVAEKILAKKGEGSQVSYGAGLDISKDTLIVYLPEAGNTPGAPVNASAPGITCVHFGYNMMPGANDSYDISIVPEEKYSKDVNNIKKISLHISKQGYADLTVITGDQGALAYHGYIKQPEATFPGAKSVVTNY